MRKIIHIDMDCFYAAIEVRDNPSLQNKPIAVGGSADNRGVLCTCNYIARKFGVRSAMPTVHALKLCPELILLPPNMGYYRQVSEQIRMIFQRYSDSIEPLSLDEAYLDVSNSDLYRGSATLIAKAIQQAIFQEHQLTASAGVASNKFLAKIASDWYKPKGLFVITPDQIDSFMLNLPIEKIHGVGKVTAQRLHQLQIYHCGDLQKASLAMLCKHFGKSGENLYWLSRGIDNREVETHRHRKSLSVEHTFAEDLLGLDHCLKHIPDLFKKLQLRAEKSKEPIKTLFFKIKFQDFTQTTVEHAANVPHLKDFVDLCKQAYQRRNQPVRLLGLGMRFAQAERVHQESLGF